MVSEMYRTPRGVCTPQLDNSFLLEQQLTGYFGKPVVLCLDLGGESAGTVSSEGTGDALDAENAESAKGGSSQVASEKGERGEEHAVVVVGAVKSEEAI